jgi:protein AATF/BFR2
MFLLSYEMIATTDSASLHPYMLQTLSKWSTKVQAVAPSAFLPSNRGTFLKGHKHLQSAVQLVDENLSDKAKLLERTRVVRLKKERIARPLQLEPESEIPDLENFDDTDFYQKLLQSVIDSRGSSVRDEGWQLLQKQKREKKKADTKASKGRKLRYVNSYYFKEMGSSFCQVRNPRKDAEFHGACPSGWCLA